MWKCGSRRASRGKSILNRALYSRQIKEDDRISRMLCASCVEQLIRIAEFRILLIESNEMLHKEFMKGDKSTEAECNDDESENIDCGDGNEVDVEVRENVVLLEIEEATDSCQSIAVGYAQSKARTKENDTAEQFGDVTSFADHHQLDLICQICGKAFPSVKSRRIHEYVHNLGQFECKLCERILTTTGFLRVHMQNVHSVFVPKSKPSDGQAEPTECSHCQCDICKMYFPYGRIGRHMRSHAKISGRPKCPSCPQTFSCRKNLQRHQKKQHANANEQSSNEFHCVVCNETFHRPIELYEHSKDHDVDCVETCDGYNLMCDECSVQHSKYEEYARHMIDVHRVERVQPYKCRICMMRNGSRTGLYMHINCHYNGSAVARAAVVVAGAAVISGASYKPFACAYCPLRLKNARRLEEHTRVHTGKPCIPSSSIINLPSTLFLIAISCAHSAGEAPFACQECDKRFKTRMTLGKHMKSRHTAIRDHLCSVCGKDFASKSVLNEHMLQHTGERPFSCEHCDKSFTGVSRLREHTRIHTGERPYICDECFKAFRSHTNLRHHKISMHSDERKHLCTICGKKFKFNSGLKTHMWTHSGEDKPFHCAQCNEGFMRLNKLKMHSCAGVRKRASGGPEYFFSVK